MQKVIDGAYTAGNFSVATIFKWLVHFLYFARGGMGVWMLMVMLNGSSALSVG